MVEKFNPNACRNRLTHWRDKMSLLDERLYTNSDREEILEEMIKYINHNNAYEHQLLYPGYRFAYTPSPIPEKFMRDTIIQTFQDKLTMAGNVLKMQSIFIAKIMPHIRSYLYKAGVSHSFCFFKPCDIMMTELTSRAIRSNSIEDAIEHIMKDNNKEKGNPFNIFYNISLVIDKPTLGFIKDMDKLHGITRSEDKIPSGPMTISLLPANNGSRRIDEIVRMIHKHF